MRFLVYLAHVDPAVAHVYENAATAALAPLGHEATILLANRFIPGRLSSAYEIFSAELRARGGGSLSKGLLSMFPPPGGRERYASIGFASFSAGYALGRQLLSEREGQELLELVCGIDSFHSSKDVDGSPSDSQLGGLVQFAARAKSAAEVCFLGHSDVQTPPSYSSTTDVAAEVARLAGGVGGGFLVRGYDLEEDQTKEHVQALRTWGAPFLAESLVTLARRKSSIDLASTSAARLDALAESRFHFDLGPEMLELARAELAAGIREVPGPASEPRIVEYFEGCMRGGTRIGQWLASDAHAWCAAAQGWLLSRAARARGVSRSSWPHGWRAAVREMWIDALASGAAISADRVRSGEYVPVPGDAWIGTRGITRGARRAVGRDPFAATEGKGHTGCVELFSPSSDGDAAMGTLDGNVSDTWTRVSRSPHDSEFVGVINRTGGLPVVPSDVELSAARRLNALQDALRDGVGLGVGAAFDV